MNEQTFEQLLRFSDAGTITELQKKIKQLDNVTKNLMTTVKLTEKEIQKLDGLQRVAADLGFGADPKSVSAANKLVASGGAEAQAKLAQQTNLLNKRKAEAAEIQLKLQLDNLNRDKSHSVRLSKAQTIELKNMNRKQFLETNITNSLEAQAKTEAAIARQGEALRRLKNARTLPEGLTKDDAVAGAVSDFSRSTQDIATVQAQVSEFKNLESVGKRVQAQQVKINSALQRANILRQEGNTTGAKAEIQNARLAKAAQLKINQERLTNAQLKEQVRLNESIARAKTRAANTADPLESLNNRLKDGGAGLLKIQAQLLANYAAMGLAMRALAFAGRFVVELDKEFAQLQAITGTTDQAMGKLEKTVIKVSEGVKFTALEVAEAATVMGQAGFSVDQITSSIGDITLLATAVGTDLNTAVDLVTSTISVFNLRAEEAGNIANVFTTAVNNSKLNLEKLTLGLQYAGNIANEQNITFSELTATLGAMANSGIRSGSTLGTGLRQILTALAAPSEKLSSRLTELGLSTDDVNVKLHGLTGVLSNLQEAGFTTSDALQVLEVRAGAAYAALTNNSSTIDDLRQKFLLSSAAAEANSVQMEALANKGARLESIFGTIAAKALDPLVDALKVAADALAVMLTVLNKTGPLLGILTTLITAYTVSLIANRAAQLALNLVGKQHIAVRLKEAAAVRASQIGMKGLAGAMGPVGLGIVAITAAVALAKLGFDFFTVSIDELKAKVDESSGQFETYTQNLRAIDKELDILSQRHFAAGVSMQEVNNIALELQLKFADLGSSFDFTSGSVSGLKEELSRLKDEMLQIQNINISENLLALDDLQAAQRDQTLSAGRQFFQSVEVARTLADGNTVSGDSRIGNALQLPSGVGQLGKFDALDDKSFDELLALRQELTNLNSTLVEERNRFRGRDDSELSRAERIEKNYVDAFQKAFVDYRLAVDRELGTATDRKSVTQQAKENTFRQRDDIRDFETSLLAQEVKLGTAKANRSEFTNKGLSLPEGAQSIEEVVAETKKIVTDFNEALSDTDKITLLTTGISANAQALVSRSDAALKLTDAQLREEDAIFKQQQTNRQREIDNIKRSLNLENSALDIAKGRAQIMGLLVVQEQKALQENTARLDREGVIGARREREEAVFAEGLEQKREKIIASLDKLALDKEIKTRGIAFESLEIQLDKEIALERKRVTVRTSVNEIEAARARALVLQGQKETAARDDLRFRLRNDTALLNLEMVKLNATLAVQREEISLSYDGLTRDLKDKQVPKVRNALKALTDSFTAGSDALKQKIEDLQKPVTLAQAQRDSLDAPSNAGRFSEADRAAADREIYRAETEALAKELDLLKNSERLRLDTNDVQLTAQLAAVDQKIAQANAQLANTTGGASPQQMKDANTAVNQLETQRLAIRKELQDNSVLLMQNEATILELTTQLGVKSGEIAPAMSGWVDSARQSLSLYMKELKDAIVTSGTFGDKAVELADVLTNSLGDALFDMATGAKSVGEAMGDMAKDFIKAILKMIAQQLAYMAVVLVMRALGVPVVGFSGGGQVGGAGGQNQQASLPAFATGGVVPSLGVVGRDAVPIMAQAGEFVLRNSAVQSIGKEKLFQMNAMGAEALEDRDLAPIVLGNTGTQEVNVWLVQEGTKPVLGPNDVLQIIGDDILKRGQTKTLIKQVTNGTI